MTGYIIKRYLNDIKHDRRRSLSISSIDSEALSSLQERKELFQVTMDLLKFRANIISSLNHIINTISEDVNQSFDSKNEALNVISSMEYNWLFEWKECVLFVDKEFKRLKEKYASENRANVMDVEDDYRDLQFTEPIEIDDDDIPENMLQSMMAHLDASTENKAVQVTSNDGSKTEIIENQSSSTSDISNTPKIKVDERPALVASSSRLSLRRTTLIEDGAKQLESFRSLLLEEVDEKVNILDEVPESASSCSDNNISLQLSSNGSLIIPKSSVIRMTYEDNQENKHTLSRHYVQTDECCVLVPMKEKQMVDNYKRKLGNNREEPETDKDNSSGSELFRKVTPVKRRKLPSLSSSSSSDYDSPDYSKGDSDENDDRSSINENDNLSLRYSSDTEAASNASECLDEIPDIYSSFDDSDESLSEKSSRKNAVTVKKKRVQKRKREETYDESEAENDSDAEWRNDPLLSRLQIEDDDELSKKKNLDTSTTSHNNSVEVKVEDTKPIINITQTRTKLRLKKPVVLEDSDDDDGVWPILLTPEKVAIMDEGNSDNSDVEFISSSQRKGDDSPLTKGRRNIKEILSEEELNVDTRKAHEEEKKRIERLEAKQLKQTQNFCSQESLVSDLVLDANDKHPISVQADLAKKLLPHQRQGVQFLWDNCYESVERIQAGDLGSGCILAHCMGLGKTLQVVTLVHTLLKNDVTKTKKVIIIAPLSVLPNWRKEFRDANKLTKKSRYQVNIYNSSSLEAWNSRGGVLIIGYCSFLTLIQKGVTKTNASLMDPGADLIVCDEGHLLKNGFTKRTKIISNVKTKRRIILTGTPMQNNLDEYFYMVGFVKPCYLGTQKEYRNRFVNPIHNGQFEDSSYIDIQIMKKRSHVLHKITRNFIQRYEETELSQHLPEKHDYALKIEINVTQSKLLKTFLGLCNYRNLFGNLIIIRDLITHPHLIRMRALALENQNTKDAKKGDPTQEVLAVLNEKGPDWWKHVMPDDSATNIAYGTKMMLMLSIVQQTMARKEKILIFSVSLSELDLIEMFLKQSDARWARGRSYYRIDGNVHAKKREKYCTDFNSPTSTIKLMLLTPLVGGLGLNLYAANRAILMDVSWNPAHDSQSVFRIYRLGQKKACYIYRFIAMGTMEEVIYERSVTKQAISRRVVDEQQIMRHFQSSDLESLYRYKMLTPDASRPMRKLPQDEILANLLQEHKFIYSYHDHKELLQNRPDEELDDDEMKLAWEEYEREKDAPVWNPLIAALPITGTSTNYPMLPPGPIASTSASIPLPSTNYNPRQSALPIVPVNVAKPNSTASNASTASAANSVVNNIQVAAGVTSTHIPTTSKHRLEGKLVLYESPAAKNGYVRATFDADGRPTNAVSRDFLTPQQFKTALNLRMLTSHELRGKMLVITRAGRLKELEPDKNPLRKTTEQNKPPVFEHINLIDED